MRKMRIDREMRIVRVMRIAARADREMTIVRGMPIAREMYRVLYEDVSPREALQRLMTRALKAELA